MAILAGVDPIALREQFPVLRRLAYLNAGTDGPLSTQAARAAQAELEREVNEGRAQAHFERRSELNASLRAAYARVLGCREHDIALTTCTSEGVAVVVGGLDLAAGDEIVTSDEEHPGLLGALQAARDLRGVSVRMVALPDVADAVGPRTRLVACSHVGWVSGRVAPAALADVDVPVLFDGAQGAGAIPVDIEALGCDAYAGSGQKWLCGPDGSGLLYVSGRLRERIGVSRRGYSNLADPGAGLAARLQDDARRFDTLSMSVEAIACAAEAIAVLERAGWPAVHERARALAQRLAERLADRGREVAPRGPTTLVAFSSDDPAAERERLAERGVVLRDLPGRPLLRASVGAWNDEGDLDRLLAALGDVTEA